MPDANRREAMPKIWGEVLGVWRNKVPKYKTAPGGGTVLRIEKKMLDHNCFEVFVKKIQAV